MPRKLFTTREFLDAGFSTRQLYRLERSGTITRVDHGVFADGSTKPDAFTKAIARVVASGAPATGLVGGAVYELDAIEHRDLLVPSRRRAVAFGGAPEVVDGVMCASGLQIIVELAAILDDLRWEQALESGLRKGLFTVAQLGTLLPELSGSRTHGAPRIRRVLDLRPPGAPATGSMLETLMVQLARATPDVPEPERQVVVNDEHGEFVARVDLAWQDLGAFNELDGMGHKDQPIYDASRETSVVAAKGWLCGRFTWYEVRHTPITTARKLARFVDQARRRPLAS